MKELITNKFRSKTDQNLKKIHHRFAYEIIEQIGTTIAAPVNITIQYRISILIRLTAITYDNF